MTGRFAHFSPLHNLILVLTLIVTAMLVVYARRSGSEKNPRYLGYAIGAILLANYAAYVVYRIHSGHWAPRYDLPMELCNWAAFATSLALFTRNRFVGELAYFWVMAGSVNGVISPDLTVTFPHPYFFIFFIAHSGLVCGVLYLVFGLKAYPRPRAVLRVWLFSQVYLATAFLTNYALGGNYGYTMAKPAAGSLLDYLGPWPWYLLSLEGLALLLYFLLYLPFFLLRQRVKESA